MNPRPARPLVSRRRVLQGLAGAIAAPAFLRTVNAQGVQKLKFTMSWLPEGTFAYVYVAKTQGFWKDKGLDVDVSRGFGSLASAQALAAGQFDFGMSTVDATVVLATKGVDLRCLAMFDYIPTMGVAVLASSGIKTPKDLEGKTVGQTVASSDAAFFPAFCAKAGVDYSKIKVVNIDAKIRNQTLVEKRVDAITGIATSIIPAVTSSGSDVRYLLYSDYGLPLYGNINLLARPQTIAGLSRTRKRRVALRPRCDSLHDSPKPSRPAAGASPSPFSWRARSITNNSWPSTVRRRSPPNVVASSLANDPLVLRKSDGVSRHAVWRRIAADAGPGGRLSDAGHESVPDPDSRPAIRPARVSAAAGLPATAGLPAAIPDADAVSVNSLSACSRRLGIEFGIERRRIHRTPEKRIRPSASGSRSRAGARMSRR